MRSYSTLVCLFLVASMLGCKKSEPSKPAAPAAKPMERLSAPQSSRPSMMPMRPPQPKPEEVKGLLTEDKIARFLTYQKEMTSHTSEAMGMGLAAVEKVGTDRKKLEKAVTKDDRYAKLAAAGKAALAKSGLTQDEMTKLTRVLSPYYARVYAVGHLFGKPVDGKPDTAKAEPPKPGSAEAAKLKAQERRRERLETTRKEFADRYGAEALELVKKHEPEFMEINKQMMGAAFSAMGGRK